MLAVVRSFISSGHLKGHFAGGIIFIDKSDDAKWLSDWHNSIYEMRVYIYKPGLP